VEAADNGLLAPDLANGGVASKGLRLGNWLTEKQAQALLNALDVSTNKGLRGRAILAVLLGCGSGVPRWRRLPLDKSIKGMGAGASLNLVGKHGRVRTVPVGPRGLTCISHTLS
jgi:site-specific recombinase XerD